MSYKYKLRAKRRASRNTGIGPVAVMAERPDGLYRFWWSKRTFKADKAAGDADALRGNETYGWRCRW